MASNLSWLGLALLRAVLRGPLTAADSDMAPSHVMYSGTTVDSSQFVWSYLELVSRSRAGEDREPSNVVSSAFDGKNKAFDTRRPHLHQRRRPDLRDTVNNSIILTHRSLHRTDPPCFFVLSSSNLHRPSRPRPLSATVHVYYGMLYFPRTHRITHSLTVNVP